MAKVSIIVPIYNSVQFIRECIDSIVGQTLKDLEILLVDAGSTDGTLEILKEYRERDSRIRLLHSEKKSTGYQYNLGIAQATGKYVGFVESDDYIVPTMYEKLSEFMEHYPVDYVKSDFDVFVKKKKKLFLRCRMLGRAKQDMYYTEFKPREHIEFMLTDIFMWNGLYDMEFIRKNNIHLNESPKAAAQDMGFVMQTFCAAKRIMYVEEDSYKYRKDNTASSSYDVAAIKNVTQEMEYARDILLHRYENDPIFLAGICWKCWSLFCGFYGRFSFQEDLGEDVFSYINRFQRAFLDVYKKIPYKYTNITRLDESCGMLLSDNLLDEGFKEVATSFYQRAKKLWKYVNRYRKVVIFGAGMMGSCWCGILKNNDFPGEILFCDNSAEKWGSSLLDSRVLSPNEALDVGDGTIYLIANERHWKEIHNQLLNGGVDEEDICKIIPCLSVGAFEVHLNP